MLAALAAVIVNHEDWPATLEQLRAHRADDPERFAAVEWLVLDNGTSPASPMVDDFFADPAFCHVRWLRIPNRGYGAAVNRATTMTERPFLLALNADQTPTPGFLAGVDRAVLELQEDMHRRVGIVGFRLQNPDGSPQGSSGPLPTLRRVLAGLLRSRATRKYRPVRSTTPLEVPWVTGACMLLRRQCLADLGGFDERFFLYYEDVDMCLRAARSGWKVQLDPRCAVTHLYPYHLRPLTGSMVRLARRSMLLYFWKHRPRWEFELLRGIMLAECRYRRWCGQSADDDLFPLIRAFTFQRGPSPIAT